MTVYCSCTTRDGGEQVVKIADGVASFVPADPANADWQAYQEWLAEGNTPEPWPPAE